MKAHFKQNKIDVTIPIEGKIRTLQSEVSFYSEITKTWIVAPIGMKTDFGSIPQFLQNIFPKDGEALFAYIIHDYLYKSGKYSQSISDDVLEEAMEVLTVAWWRRKAVHNGLRVGGFVAYNNYRNGEKETK